MQPRTTSRIFSTDNSTVLPLKPFNPNSLKATKQMFAKSTLTVLATLAITQLAVAQNCFPGGQGSNVNGNDLSSLANSIANDNLDPRLPNPFPLNRLSTQSFVNNNAGVCVENDFVFENTHVFLADTANAAQSIFNKCNAQGGQQTIKGDSGLNVVVTVFQPGHFDCSA